jgi:hypothetical protein
MTESEHLDERTAALLSRLRGGTFRFWGEWFGKPYGNWHRLVRCEADGDIRNSIFTRASFYTFGLRDWQPLASALSGSPLPTGSDGNGSPTADRRSPPIDGLSISRKP